jgi:serine/threonine protein kinase
MLAKLGKGGFGAVYKAKHLPTNVIVALKKSNLRMKTKKCELR